MLPADRKENKNSVEDTVGMQEVLAFVPSTTTSALVLVMSQQESLMDIDSLTYQKWGKVLQATGKNKVKTVGSKQNSLILSDQLYLQPLLVCLQ